MSVAFPADLSSPTNTAALPRSDSNGNPLRRAPTGHVSNYDESKVGSFKLPDPLLMKNGQTVKDAETWLNGRRPEILQLYENEIYGRVPSSAPKASFAVTSTTTNSETGVATRQIVARFGEQSNSLNVAVTFWFSSTAKAPLPLLLHMTFFGATTPAGRGGAGSE
jgi:hypothetical protein